MPDYTKNHQTAISGHTGGTEDPVVHSDSSGIAQMADVRDLLSALVGAGKGGLRPDDQSAVYARLGSILGKETAQRLISQALVFNQRSDMSNKSAEQRITSFYDMGSRDPGINTLINKTKMLGQGPVSGANESVNALTKKVYGGDDVKNVGKSQSNMDQLAGSVKTASGGF